jgi:hypothetical protein
LFKLGDALRIVTGMLVELKDAGQPFEQRGLPNGEKLGLDLVAPTNSAAECEPVKTSSTA